ncbi:hypothetical protein BYT27DRAFT_7180348 [Phlegmacium glaucopus]|nr:hypothetical protein BYT27DRAFT_7180348 [Phlegmacium glaucopus]
MSYASVAANNIPPPSEQPHPDTALLNTSPTTQPLIINKATIDEVPMSNDDSDKRKGSSKRMREVEAEGLYLWQVAKHYLTRPAVAGGLFGIINIGLLVLAGRKFYRYPHLRRDATAISASFSACIVLVATEGYVATKYRQMIQEKERKGGIAIFRQFNEHIGP